MIDAGEPSTDRDRARRGSSRAPLCEAAGRHRPGRGRVRGLHDTFGLFPGPGHGRLPLSASITSWIARRYGDCQHLARHIARRWFVYLPLAIGYGWALAHIKVNVSHSLPYWLVYLERQPLTIARGDLVVFRYEGDGAFPELRAGPPLCKRVRGVAGDRVSVDGRNVFVDAALVGLAKPRAWDGKPLEPIEPVVIPAGSYFVQGQSPDSFDSRYREQGLVRAEQILGKAHVIF